MLRQDLRFGLRALWVRKSFSLVAILTLGIGIGAATTIFSVAEGVLWRPLPYPDPDQVVVAGWWRDPIGDPDAAPSSIAPPMLSDWQRESASFSAMAGVVRQSLDLVGEGEPRRFRGAGVSADFAAVFGIEMQFGRWFSPSDDQPGAAPTVVLSHDVWRDQWGADPAVVGRTIRLGEAQVTVLGVLSPDFVPPEAVGLSRVGMWIPLTQIAQDLTTHNNRFVRVVARLRDGTGVEAAQAELETVTASLIQGYPLEHYDEPFRTRIEGLSGVTVAESGGTLVILLGAVGFLLLLVCANVANLQLLRGNERVQELTVRSALGASSSRLFRQLLTESLLLAGFGGALGVLLAHGGLSLFVALNPGDLPRLIELDVDGPVLGFSAVVACLTGLVFGLIPALRASGMGDAARLREGGGKSTGGPAGSRFQQSLLVLQAGLAMVLLVGAGLLMNSFVRLVNVDPGFDPDGLTAVHVRLGQGYTGDRDASVQAFQSMADRVSAVPGVASVALANGLPFGSGGAAGSLVVEGSDPTGSSGRAPFVHWQLVGADYFRTLGVPVGSGGRGINAGDIADRRDVVVANQAFVDDHFPGESAVGKRLKVIRTGDDAPWMEIIGVVPNMRQRSLREPVRPELFVPFTHPPFVFPNMHVVVNSDRSSSELAPELRAAIWDVDQGQPVDWVSGLEDRIAGSVAGPQFYTALLVLFASVALTIAAVGLYGSLAYSVSLRRREYGIRMALGASIRDVSRTVVGQGVLVVVLGGLGGGLVAFALSDVLSAFLFGVGGADLTTYAIVGLVLVSVGALAGFIPARNAGRVSIVEVLKAD